MIESPVIQELVQEVLADTKHEIILRFLRKRFGAVPDDLALAVQAVIEEQRLDDLLDQAAFCPDMAAFRASIQAGV